MRSAVVDERSRVQSSADAGHDGTRAFLADLW